MASEKFHIDVVDDDISFREAIVSLLNSFGYSTASFASAIEYLETKATLPPSCLILDVRMPAMTGLELQSRLTARGAKCPIIFVSASADERTRGLVLQAGATAIFSKNDVAEGVMRMIRLTLQPKVEEPDTD